MTDCPCGGGAYLRCCGPLHDGAPAASAEKLMRSRYSAYALRRYDYLRASWHGSTLPADLGEENGEAVKWLGLSVKRHVAEGDHASVEFVARFRVKGRGQRLHEISRFVREDGRWYYVDGQLQGN